MVEATVGGNGCRRGGGQLAAIGHLDRAGGRQRGIDCEVGTSEREPARERGGIVECGGACASRLGEAGRFERGGEEEIIGRADGDSTQRGGGAHRAGEQQVAAGGAEGAGAVERAGEGQITLAKGECRVANHFGPSQRDGIVAGIDRGIDLRQAGGAGEAPLEVEGVAQGVA